MQSTTDQRTETRRSALELLGAARALIVAGGAGALIATPSEPAAATETSLDFQDKTVSVPKDKQVEDVTLGGEITGEYYSPERDVGKVIFAFTLNWRDDTIINDRYEFTSVDTEEDTVTIEPSYSLVEDTKLNAGTFSAHKESSRERRHTFTLIVNFTVYSADGSQIIDDRQTDTATYKAVYDPPDEQASGELTGGVVTFSAHLKDT